MPYNQPGVPAVAPIHLTPAAFIDALDGELLANLDAPGSALSLCAWGSPGIGKSQAIHQAATARGYTVIELRAAQIDSVDVRGLPAVIDRDGVKVSVWTRPGFFPDSTAGPVLLFLDEINRAAQATQNALFQLLDQRRIGDHILPANVVVVGACNRVTDGGGVMQMPAALSNRFVRLNIEADLAEWGVWAAKHGINPALVAFLNFRPVHFNAFDPKAEAFPTPRSWSFVDRILSRKHANGAVELALIAGAVGQAAAVECIAFLRLFRSLPNMDAIIANPHPPTPTPDAAKPDVIYAVAAALAMRATARNFANVLVYLDRLPGEFSTFAVKDAINRDPSLKAAPGYAAWEIAHQDDLKA